MGKPFFSVILTEHNSEEYMHKMLVSINNQTFQDFELIIVCDKCSDNTVGQAELFSYKSRGDKIITTDFGRCGLAIRIIMPPAADAGATPAGGDLLPI